MGRIERWRTDKLHDVSNCDQLWNCQLLQLSLLDRFYGLAEFGKLMVCHGLDSDGCWLNPFAIYSSVPPAPRSVSGLMIEPTSDDAIRSPLGVDGLALPGAQEGNSAWLKG